MARRQKGSIRRLNRGRRLILSRLSILRLLVSSRRHRICKDESANRHVTLEHNGEYYVDCKPAMDIVKPYAVDKHTAKQLWIVSEELVGQIFEY